MDVQFFFKNVDEKTQKHIQEYFEKKRNKLEALVKGYDSDTVQLKVNVEQFAKKDAGSVEFVLNLPHHGTVMAKESSHLFTKAIDDAKDRLVRQIVDIKDRYLNKH